MELTWGLDGKVALIVGASEGIGFASARLLRQANCRVALTARDAKRLAGAADDLARDEEIRPLELPGDVLDPSAAERWVQATIGHFGRLDIVVVATGHSTEGLLEELDDPQWRDSFELNVLAVARVFRQAVPYLRTVGGGRLICISAASAKQAKPNQLASNVTKAGLLNLVKTLSHELAADNILVNSVCPGSILSPRRRRRAKDRAEQRGTTERAEIEAMSRAIPLGRLGEPEDVAGAVLFLASQHASYITGESLNVDGGFVRSLL